VSRFARLVLGLAALVAVLSAAGAQAATVYTTRSSSPGQIYQLQVTAGGDIALNTPNSVSAQNGLQAAAITPDGLHLYATNTTSASVSQFGAGAGGLLAPLNPATVSIAAESFTATVSPDGGSFYSVSASGGPTIEQFSVQADGTLAPKSPLKVGSGSAGDIVVSPDGRYLYVTNFGNPGAISQFAIQAGGVLKELATPSISTGAFPVGMAISPDGAHLYVGHESVTGISQFTIGAGGGLAPMTPPNVTLPAKTNAEDLAITPDGNNLYADDAFEGGITQFSIGADGALSAPTPPKVEVGTRVSAIQVSPDGHSLYAGDSAKESTRRFAIGIGGGLESTKNELTATGFVNQIAVSPDQGPTAALTLTPSDAGAPTLFDASGSRDPDGQVVRYEWSFGDGATETTDGPTTRHVYRRAGDFTTTVKVTDNEGASTARVSTGHQVLRNGGPAAQVSQRFHVAPTLVKISGLRLRPQRFAVGSPQAKHRRGRPRRGAFLSFRLDAAGAVAEHVDQLRAGHRHKGRCSLATKRGKPCKSWKPLKGNLGIAGKQGANRLVFSGRFQGRKLRPGVYRVALTPRSDDRSGPTSYARFTILPG
jgi:6-phosphogluconolactonase